MRRDRDKVGLAELQEAVERVVAGLEKRNRVLSPDEKKRVAYHELGHALVASALPGTDTLHKISIIPRGVAALGYTMQVPTEDRFLMTESELKNKVATLLGGRAAEELIYDEVSTGAHDDLSKATDIARSMVKTFGMSPRLGQVSFEKDRRGLMLQAPIDIARAQRIQRADGARHRRGGAPDHRRAARAGRRDPVAASSRPAARRAGPAGQGDHQRPGAARAARRAPAGQQPAYDDAEARVSRRFGAEPAARRTPERFHLIVRASRIGAMRSGATRERGPAHGIIFSRDHRPGRSPGVRDDHAPGGADDERKRPSPGQRSHHSFKQHDAANCLQSWCQHNRISGRTSQPAVSARRTHSAFRSR